MRLGDRDFPIDPRALEGGSISFSEGAAAVGCPARALRRVEELEAAVALQSALAAAPDSSLRWCSVSTGTVDDGGREIFYVLSQLPEGGRSLAALLEAESASPATFNEFRRATLAWSLAVGALRALADIHERGIHHGELSAESAMRDRIIVRPRPDGALDVLLQFPSPRLARLLQEERQAEVASADQTDVARLAHILRAVLHGREVLDPDTSIDELLLSRLFGGNGAAWIRFFEGCTRGALHGDPAFVRAQLALLEPAKPAEESSAAARDLKFRLARLFAQPLVRIGSVAAGVAVVGIVTLALMWSKIFPPVRWSVKLDSDNGQNELLNENNPIRVIVQREGQEGAGADAAADPAEVIGFCHREGEAEPFAKLNFVSLGDRTWRADPLPNSDLTYEVRFEKGFAVDGGPIKVRAENATPTYQVDDGSRTSDDDGRFRLVVTGKDPDSTTVAEPVVKIGGRNATLRPADGEPERGEEAGPLASSKTWIAEVDLSDLQNAAQNQRAEILIDETRLPPNQRALLRSIPFELNRVPPEGTSPEEGSSVTLRLEPKRDRAIGTKERSASIKFTRTDLAEQTVKFDNGTAAFKLPEADESYKVSVAVAGVKDVTLEFDVVADDDATFTVTVGELEGTSSPRAPMIRVPLQIRVDDPDTESTAIARPEVFDGETRLTLLEVREESTVPREGSRGVRLWNAVVELPRGEVDRLATLELRGTRVAGAPLARSKEVSVAGLPKSEPVILAGKDDPKQPSIGPAGTQPGTTTVAGTEQPKGEPATQKQSEPVPPPRPGPPLARASPEKIQENHSTEIEAFAANKDLPLDARTLAATAWRLIDAPPPLKTAIETQVNAINSNPTRAGTLRAPEYNAPYRITLELRSSDPAFPEPSRIAIDVGASDDGSVVDVVTDSRGTALTVGEENVVSDGVIRIAVKVVDPDSPIKAPEIRVNGEPWSDFSEGAEAALPQVSEKVFRGDIRVSGGARSEISVNSKTYVVRWDPKSPSDAGIDWVGFTQRPDGAWLSAPIGISGDEFGADASALALQPNQLAQLLARFDNSGFEARLVSAEELSATMKSQSNPPGRPAIIQSLLSGSDIRTLRNNPGNSGVAWIDGALGDVVKNDWNQIKEPGRGEPDSDRAVRATFCGDVASPQVIGLPITRPQFTGSDKQKGDQLRQAFDLLWSDGAWNPRPLPADAPVKSAYARVVLVKRKTSD
jgi:hypothetical protein